MRRAVGGDDAGAGGGGEGGVGGRGRGRAVLVAEDVAPAGAVGEQAGGQVVDGLARGQAVQAAAVVVGDDVGVAAAGAQHVRVVAARRHRARGVVDGDVVQRGAALGRRGRRGGGEGGRGRHVAAAAASFFLFVFGLCLCLLARLFTCYRRFDWLLISCGMLKSNFELGLYLATST